MINKTVYLVKFDCGYESDELKMWSFTDDPYRATHHKSHWLAERIGYAGIDAAKNGKYGKTFTIEQYTLNTTMKLNDD